MKSLKKSITICIAGNTLADLKIKGQYEAMKSVMLGDRFFDRAEEKVFHVLDSISRHKNELRQIKCKEHLSTISQIVDNL